MIHDSAIWELLSYLDGVEIGWRPGASLEAIGALQARFHDTVEALASRPQRPSGLPLATVTGHLSGAHTGLADVGDRMSSLLDEIGHAARRFGVIHGDFTAHNVIVDPRSLHPTGVIDLGLAHLEATVADIGDGLWLSGRPHQCAYWIDPSRAAAWVRGYTTQRPLDERDVRAIPVYMIGRGLQMAAKRLRAERAATRRCSRSNGCSHTDTSSPTPWPGAGPAALTRGDVAACLNAGLSRRGHRHRRRGQVDPRVRSSGKPRDGPAQQGSTEGAMHSAAPAATPSESLQLSDAAMHVLYDTAANSPAGAVLDANWQPDIDGTRLMELALPLVQVFCDLPPQLAQRRLLARVESGQRHPVHRDAIDPDVLRRMVQQAAEPAQPLPVPVPVVHVDASTDVDIDLVVAQLRKHMAFAPQPGGWHNAAQVNAYLDRVDRLPRVAGEELLVDLLPAQPERILDLGCGDGRLAALVLRARPSIREALATDISTPMLERARERFAGDPRVQVLRRDLHRPLDDLGAFDVVVSGCAIHHVDDDRKRTLFSEIARNVRPGGLFANLEVVQSATPAMHAAFLAAVGRDADDPEDRLAPVDAQLTWMREAGLQHVDCLWRWRGLALLVGQSPPHT